MSEHQYLIRYCDFTLSTFSLGALDAEYLADGRGIDEVRKVRGYSKVALDEGELRFKEKAYESLS